MGLFKLPIDRAIRPQQCLRLLKFYTQGEYPHMWAVLDGEPRRLRHTKYAYGPRGRQLVHCVAMGVELDVMVDEGYFAEGFRVTDLGRAAAVELFGPDHALSAHLKDNLPYQLLEELRRNPEAIHG